METGIIFFLGLIAGGLLGKIAAEHKTKGATGGIIVKSELTPKTITDSLEQLKERIEKIDGVSAASIIYMAGDENGAYEEPIPTTGGSGESKKTTMTQKELFEKYLSLSERWQYMNGQGDQKRQELLEKAERILDAAGHRFTPAVKMSTNSCEAVMEAAGDQFQPKDAKQEAINVVINSTNPKTFKEVMQEDQNKMIENTLSKMKENFLQK